MSRQLWRELLDHPTRAFDPESAGLTLIAGGGEVAHRYALRRWLALQISASADAQIAIAVILAESFDDRRALDLVAERSVEPYPQQFARFDGTLGPTSLVAKVFGERILAGLRAYLADEGDLPFGLLAAALRFRLDDHGEVYLPLRSAASHRTAGSSSATLGESFSDRALEVAAAATPNRDEVQRTVLAHWGINFPAEEVPIEESRAGFAPTRWLATSHLIAGIDRPRIADVFIDIALTYGYWSTPTTDATAFVEALRTSCGIRAQDALAEIARAEVSASAAALRALADRQARVAAGSVAARARIDSVARALVDAGVLRSIPSEEDIAQLIPPMVFRLEASDESVAIDLITAAGCACSFRLMGQFEPPFVEAVDVAMSLSGGTIGFDNAFLEPTAIPDAWILRYTRDNERHTRELISSGNTLPVERLRAFLDEVSGLRPPTDGRRLLLLEHDYLDAVVGYLDPVAWEQFLQR